MDLTGQLSKNLHLITALEALPLQDLAEIDPVPLPALRKPQRRLTPKQRGDLVVRYNSGASQRELAELYGITRQTVGNIIRRSKDRRRRGLDKAGVEEAIRRYAAGESLAKVGKALGVDAGTVRNQLLKHGVRMRDTQGRTRS